MLTLVLITVFGLVACSNDSGTDSGNPTAEAKTEEGVEYKLDKPVTVYAPGGAGGGLDTTARVLVKAFQETDIISQSLNVENVPGGGQTTGLTSFISNDPKNEYKLLLPSAPIVINYLRSEAPSPYSYDDMKPIAQLTTDYGAIIVQKDSPYQTLQELYDAIKADPSKVTFAGGSGAGSMDHIVAMMPAIKAGIDPKIIKYTSYDAGGAALVALLGGHADALTTGLSEASEFLEAGQIRILGVSAPERVEGVFAEVPTFKEAGYDAEFINWRGLFAVKDMPAEAVKYWENKIEELTQSDVWKAELEKNNWGDGFKNSDDFHAYLKEQDKVISEILKELGMAK